MNLRRGKQLPAGRVVYLLCIEELTAGTRPAPRCHQPSRATQQVADATPVVPPTAGRAGPPSGRDADRSCAAPARSRRRTPGLDLADAAARLSARPAQPRRARATRSSTSSAPSTPRSSPRRSPSSSSSAPRPGCPRRAGRVVVVGPVRPAVGARRPRASSPTWVRPSSTIAGWVMQRGEEFVTADLRTDARVAGRRGRDASSRFR